MEPAAVRKELSVNTLSLESTPEEDVGDCHGDIVNDTTGGNQVDQPSQNFVGATRNLEERQAGEQHDEEETEDRDTILSGLAEDTRGTAFDGQTVERASSAVGVGVASGEDGSDKQSVNQVRQSDDSHVLHGNDIGRCGSGTTTRTSSGNNGNQLGVVVCDNDASGESSTDEEDSETPVDGLEGGLDVCARALGLSSDHGDIFWADDAERCGPEGSAEAFKLAKGSLCPVLCERSMFPVAEAICVMLGVSTDHGDEGEGEEQEDQDDFSTYKEDTVSIMREGRTIRCLEISKLWLSRSSYCRNILRQSCELLQVEQEATRKDYKHSRRTTSAIR